MEIEPIGFFYSDTKYKAEAPRQGVFACNSGIVKLTEHQNFEMALRDLDSFERIWLLFGFHKNAGFRQTTKPPVACKDKKRVGIFASRAPYRKNGIGLSAVKLEKIEGLSLYVSETDLLNETPVFDIKPYIPASDAFPNAKAGWADFQEKDVWNISVSKSFAEENEFFLSLHIHDFISFANLQLGNAPFDASRKRVKIFGKKGVLSFRVFRILFSFDEKAKSITLLHIFSGYTKEELADSSDIYKDKDLHRLFLMQFKENTLEHLKYEIGF